MKPLQRILFVEDDRDDQEAFISIMNDLDEVPPYTIANNGKEAVDLIKRSKDLPRLIFLDINMPRMNGMEFLQEIRKDPATMSIPVVMLSTSSMQKKQAKELGANAYLKKSSNYENVRDQLLRMLNLDFVNDSFTASQTFTMDPSSNAELY